MIKNKKRYSGLKYGFEFTKPKYTSKGLQTRTAIPFTREVTDTINKLIMEHPTDLSFAKNYAIDNAKKLLAGKVEESRLVASAKFGKENYKTKPCHVVLNERLAARAPGTEWSLGDRVAYLITQGQTKDASLSDMVEDPIVAMRAGMKLNYYAYFNNKYMLPVARALMIAMLDEMKGRDFLTMPDGRTKITQKEMTHLTQKQVKRTALVLFKGLKVMKRFGNHASNSLTEWAQTGRRCLNCKIGITSDRAVCDSPTCATMLDEFRIKQHNVLQDIEDLERKVMAGCIACAGDEESANACESRSCPTTLVRIKLPQTKKVEQDTLDRLTPRPADWVPPVVKKRDDPLFKGAQNPGSRKTKGKRKNGKKRKRAVPPKLVIEKNESDGEDEEDGDEVKEEIVEKKQKVLSRKQKEKVMIKKHVKISSFFKKTPVIVEEINNDDDDEDTLVDNDDTENNTENTENTDNNTENTIDNIDDTAVDED